MRPVDEYDRQELLENRSNGSTHRGTHAAVFIKVEL